MRIEFIDAARRTLMSDDEIDWAQAYQRRMRRFNLEIILFALIALVLSTAFLLFTWWSFSQ